MSTIPSTALQPTAGQWESPDHSGTQLVHLAPTNNQPELRLGNTQHIQSPHNQPAGQVHIIQPYYNPEIAKIIDWLPWSIVNRLLTNNPSIIGLDYFPNKFNFDVIFDELLTCSLVG